MTLPKTEEEFMKRWEASLVCLGLYGYISDQEEGPMKRASRALKLPTEVRALLKQIYDYLDSKPPAATGTTQGENRGQQNRSDKPAQSNPAPAARQQPQR